MGLIIKDKIQELMAGYPTVSDKYDVTSAVVGGSTAVNFGDLVKKGSTGYVVPATSISAVGDIMGFVVATNVKLNETWPQGNVKVNPGEACGLLLHGFMAIELDSGATAAQVVPNAKAYVILATGKITTSDKASSNTIVELPNCTFTGAYELQGSKKIAEIYVR